MGVAEEGREVCRNLEVGLILACRAFIYLISDSEQKRWEPTYRDIFVPQIHFESICTDPQRLQLSFCLLNLMLEVGLGSDFTRDPL